MPLAHTIQDAFDAAFDTSATGWAMVDGAPPTTAAGAVTSAYSWIRNKNLATLVGSRVYAGPMANAAGANQSLYWHTGTTLGDGYYGITLVGSDGSINAGHSGSGITYRASPASVEWIRIKELNGNVLFQTAPAGSDPENENVWVTAYTMPAVGGAVADGYGGLLIQGSIGGYNIAGAAPPPPVADRLEWHIQPVNTEVGDFITGTAKAVIGAGGAVDASYNSTPDECNVYYNVAPAQVDKAVQLGVFSIVNGYGSFSVAAEHIGTGFRLILGGGTLLASPESALFNVTLPAGGGGTFPGGDIMQYDEGVIGYASQSSRIRLLNADGTQAALTSGSAGLVIRYRRGLEAWVPVTAAALASDNAAWAAGGIRSLGAGLHRIDLPDAAYAEATAGGNRLYLSVAATGVPEQVVEIGLGDAAQDVRQDIADAKSQATLAAVYALQVDGKVNTVQTGVTAAVASSASADTKLSTTRLTRLDTVARVADLPVAPDNAGISLLAARLTAIRAAKLDTVATVADLGTAGPTLTQIRDTILGGAKTPISTDATGKVAADVALTGDVLVDLTPVNAAIDQLREELNQSVEFVRAPNSAIGYFYLLDAAGARNGTRRQITFQGPASERILKIGAVEATP